ncbi:Alpha/Beta hydrolase protein [Venturia nashicola]|uniref:Alpha/Beta hydrolase protein n=1 Tax=Venturia nashicola TaxID=86259 RepID=A0A4Z1P3E7_9PEZI|nr:Alpha/Beta hydrolase protein [Venturia nashicola]TLD21653.1 Alpha/Beta hydrolase protein [Venturia nashicola]
MATRPVPIDVWSDPRIEHKTAVVNGQRYKYLYGVPKDGEWKQTVFLIHGWPDISAGWRYQIPVLLELGCRVVVPDMMGYGGTDAPEVPPASINLYTFKRASDDIAELARQLGAPKIILGGHDWGGMVVWRCAGWHPGLISHLFAICTPYAPPSKEYIPTEDLVNGPVPQFGYQLHLASGEVEPRINDENRIRQFLNGMYGGRGPKAEVIFSPQKGVLFENLPKVGKSPLMSDREVDYYVQEYSRNGLHGPLNWYRTRKANWEDELKLSKNTIDIPTLFIEAANDSVLKPEMSFGMERYVPNLSRRSVNAAHWAMWERPSEVNEFVKKWFASCVFGRDVKL